MQFASRFVWLLVALLGATTARAQTASAELVRSGHVSSPSPTITASAPPLDLATLPPANTLPMQESVSASAPTADSRPKLAAKGALQLAPRGHAARESVSRPAAQTPWESLTTMGASLAVVLGLFFSLAFVTRRGLRGKIAQLPGEVIEVLGKVPHVKGQELQLVRIGGKLLLLCVTPHGSEALTEFTDPTEVERLSAVCRRHHPQGVSKAFEEVLSAMGREKAQGFVSEPRTAMSSRSGVRHA